MGFWFNNFAEFEKKQTRENRLALNFYYCPDEGEEPQSVKVFVPKEVRVPTRFLDENKTGKLEEKLTKDETLKEFPFIKRKKRKWVVGEITLPKDPRILSKLWKSYFQVGNYDKLLRFRGFYPERKAEISPELEQRFLEEDEIEIENLEGIVFRDFPTEQEFRAMPYIVIDIEKPLWKADQEKQKLKAREKLLKLERRYERKPKKRRTEDDERLHTKRQRTISWLEEKLTIDAPGVLGGRVKLFDPRFKADISSVTTIWGGGKGNETKQIYLLDPSEECEQNQFEDYEIRKFKTEKDLIATLLEDLHTRKPVISYGHNQVYDWTQLRFAAEQHKLSFDPAVKDEKPKRDFVREFLQRLKESLIYFDTMWMSRIFFPYYQQRRFGTSLRLEDVAQARGVDFKKSQSHEELRFVELLRLAGETPELRQKALDEMLQYAAADVDVTKNVASTINFLPVVLGIKQALPFCTLTEIAFSPNCMNKLHEQLHFRTSGNLPYHGYGQKQRENELQIFKKRFATLKTQMLKWAFSSDRADIQKAGKGTYQNVKEHYLPFEAWMKEFTFHLSPRLKEAYEQVQDNDEQTLGFMQYIKAFLRDPLTDYYFARREEKAHRFSLDCLDLEERKAQYYFNCLTREIDEETLNSLIGSFRFLKNHFRSVYVALDKNERARIRPTKKNLSEIEVPGIMQHESDLFLLRKKEGEARAKLSEANQTVLNSFLHNFEKFETLCTEIGEAIGDRIDINPMEFLYSFVTYEKTEKDKSRFYARYGADVEEVRNHIARVYDEFGRNLKSALDQTGGEFLEQRGDYIFVTEAAQIPGTYLVRELDEYVVG